MFAVIALAALLVGTFFAGFAAGVFLGFKASEQSY